MPCSPEQIAAAWQQARERQRFHVENGDPDHQIADALAGEEVHFRGFLGQYELQNVFGVEVDLVPSRSGDGGKDGYLRLIEGRFRVDVKTSTYDGPEPYLRVPQRHLDGRTIYMAAKLDRMTCHIEFKGWEWGMVMARCPLMCFSSSGTMNHVKEYDLLRKIEELKQRLDGSALW